MLTELAAAPNKVVGAKQARRALEDGRAKQVFLAKDAAGHIADPLTELCRAHNIPLVMVDSMTELGTACQIAVGATVAVII